MRAGSLSPAWAVFLFVLLAGAAVGPGVDPLQRAAAVLGIVLVAAKLRVPRLLLVAGCALGLLGGVRQQAISILAARYDGGEHLVRFVVVERGEGRHRIWMRAPEQPPVLAWVTGLESSLDAGARGIARVQVWRIRARRNPDDRDRVRAGLAQRTILRGRVTGCRVEDGRRHVSLRDELRARARAWLHAGARGSGPLWCALLLGDRSDLPPEVSRRFQRLGLAHLLALSGLHVGLVGGLIAVLLRRWRGRDSWWPVAVVLAWSLLAGLSPSLLRAVAMVAWALAGRRLHRAAPPVESLAVIGLLEWTVAPWRLLGLGWWLSYAATAALLRVAPALRTLPKPVGLLVLTVTAQLATLPWTLGAFGFVSPAAPLFNLVAGPAFALLMAAGVSTVVLAAVVPPIAPACFALLRGTSHAFGLLLAGLDRVAPATWGHPGLHGVAWAVALGCVAIWLVPWPRRALLARLAWTLVLLLLVHGTWLLPPRDHWVSLDVGQGDAGVYRAGRSHWLVVDAGPDFGTWNGGEAVVAPYLARRNASSVSLLLTHGHRDHTGGAAALLRGGRVSRLVLAAADSGRAWAEEIEALAARHAVGVRWLAAGEELELGAERIVCLWPPRNGSGLSTNDRSLVVVAGPPGARLLLTGDLEWKGESRVESRLPMDGIAALKVAHHGGNTGTGDALLAHVSGEVAIVSCGRGNRYGHPHRDTLERLHRARLRILRTDEVGAVEISWRGESPRVRGQTRPP